MHAGGNTDTYTHARLHGLSLPRISVEKSQSSNSRQQQVEVNDLDGERWTAAMGSAHFLSESSAEVRVKEDSNQVSASVSRKSSDYIITTLSGSLSNP